jgi:hypothetical protein
LVPFIREKYSDGNYVFWPDLASSHYAKTVVATFNDENINFVPKDMNPANCPEVRPIEDFWAYLKGQVYKDSWEAENVEKLINRIKYCLSKVPLAVVQKFANSTKKRLDTVRRYGLPENRKSN